MGQCYAHTMHALLHEWWKEWQMPHHFEYTLLLCGSILPTPFIEKMIVSSAINAEDLVRTTKIVFIGMQTKSLFSQTLPYPVFRMRLDIGLKGRGKSSDIVEPGPGCKFPHGHHRIGPDNGH